MFISRSWNSAWMAVAALALLTPQVRGLAQTQVPQEGHLQATGSGSGGRGRGSQGDYNKSLRTAEDKALPNPYARNETFFKISPDRVVGSSSAIATDKDGKSIWVALRCEAQSSGDKAACRFSKLNPILKFDENGNLAKQFGAGQIVYPHGLTIDRDGNLWVADLQSNVDRAASSGRGAPDPAPPAGFQLTPSGNQVIKYSPDGKILMRLGTPGVYGNDDTHFAQPSAVAIGLNGEIYVADGHDSEPSNNRIVKFDKNGKFIKAWGHLGTGPGEFNCPHAIAVDSEGRVFVGDRTNARIQIFDADGNFLAEWKQFGRPSGLMIDKNDVIYSADSMSGLAQGNAHVRGVYIGDAKTGKVTALLPDPQGNPTPWTVVGGTTGAEGVTVDAAGNIFTAQVNPPGLAKYSIRMNVSKK